MRLVVLEDRQARDVAFDADHEGKCKAAVFASFVVHKGKPTSFYQGTWFFGFGIQGCLQGSLDFNELTTGGSAHIDVHALSPNDA